MAQDGARLVVVTIVDKRGCRFLAGTAIASSYHSVAGLYAVDELDVFGWYAGKFVERFRLRHHRRSHRPVLRAAENINLVVS